MVPVNVYIVLQRLREAIKGWVVVCGDPGAEHRNPTTIKVRVQEHEASRKVGSGPP